MQAGPDSGQREAAARLPGVVDTIGSGFALLNKRPYLIWLPVLLDVGLWLSARLSASRFAGFVADQLQQRDWADPETLALIREAGQQYDLLPLIGVGTPSLLRSLGQNAIAGPGAEAVLASPPWWSVPPIAAGLLLTSVLVSMAYITVIGDLVRERPVEPWRLSRDALRNGLRMLGLVAVVAGGALLMLLPALALGVALALVGVSVAPFAAVILTATAFWLFFLLFFSREAIVLSDAGPFRAVYLSYNVVRHNLSAAAFFFVAYFVIRTGMPFALQIFTQSVWSVPFALVGHAYVATGLAVAAMLFYRDRVRLLMATNSSESEPAPTSQ